MQICLQTERRRKKAVLKRVLVCVFGMVLVFGMLIVQRTDRILAKNGNAPEKISEDLHNVSEMQSHENAEGLVFVEKMNNEADENSKNGILYESTPENTDVKMRKVSVLCDSGEICEMELEDYVLCCLMAEMPLGFEGQALMAQAVAVRSFTVRKMLYGSVNHKNADVCTDFNCCQSFISAEDKKAGQELLQKAADAVNATKGIVAVYEGEPIEALYHASSGKRTLDSGDVWGGKVPYLKSVNSPAGEEQISRREYTFTYSELSKALSEVSDKAVSCGSFGEYVEVDMNDMSLADTVKVDGQSYDKSRLAACLGFASTDFSVERTTDGITFTSYGNGHRVGMSQHGANLLAAGGMCYADILKYYYQGISLDFLN